MQDMNSIGDLMYSSKNLTSVREEIHQYDDQFKMLVETHNEYVNLLSEDLHEGEENWFEAVVVFTQKRKVYNWMREARNNKSNRSSRSSKRSSDRSSKKYLTHQNQNYEKVHLGKYHYNKKP